MLLPNVSILPLSSLLLFLLFGKLFRFFLAAPFLAVGLLWVPPALRAFPFLSLVGYFWRLMVVAGDTKGEDDGGEKETGGEAQALKVEGSK